VKPPPPPQQTLLPQQVQQQLLLQSPSLFQHEFLRREAVRQRTASADAAAERRDDEALQTFLDPDKRDDDVLLGFLSPELPASCPAARPRRPSSAGGGLGAGRGLRPRPPATGGAQRLRAEVRRRQDIKRIVKALSSADLTLQWDVQLESVVLHRGLRLLPEGPLKGCRLPRAALENLEPWVKLTFERPLDTTPAMPRPLLPGEAGGPHSMSGGVASYDWHCPHCRSPYPVQAPFEMTARALLLTLLPALQDALAPPAGDLWLMSELGLPVGQGTVGAPDVAKQIEPTDPSGHVLFKYSAPSGDILCSVCGRGIPLGGAAHGCSCCGFFACAACHRRAQESGGDFFGAPLPAASQDRQQGRARADEAVRLLAGHAQGRFDLAPVLHFGVLLGAKGDVTECYTRRGRDGELLPMADPYDYYVRAAILHSQVPGCATPKEKDLRLHEAREALLAALDCNGPERRRPGRAPAAPNRLSLQQFGCARAQNPRAGHVDPRSHAERAAADPRIWYLLGLVLCELGAFEEARLMYRQALGRLPMAYFSHAVHFNLACIQALQPGEAARAAALRELREFRRCCRSLQGSPLAMQEDAFAEVSVCKLCGAPCV